MLHQAVVEKFDISVFKAICKKPKARLNFVCKCWLSSKEWCFGGLICKTTSWKKFVAPHL